MKKNILMLAAVILGSGFFGVSAQATEPLKDAYFAGGCFWGVEEYFSRIPGVLDVTSGYANGNTEKPTYREVCSGKTGYAEAVHVSYDPAKVSLETLTKQFFKIINPISVNKQGNDLGSQYRTGLYYADEADKPVLEKVWKEIQGKYSQPLAVELLPLKNYYPAEKYHQDYLKRTQAAYCHISFDSLKDIPASDRDSLDASNYSKPPGPKS